MDRLATPIETPRRPFSAHHPGAATHQEVARQVATIPFAISFRADMDSAQVARLSSELGLTFHSNPKLNLPFVAFVRITFDSGLYLLREQGNRWRLECRTYERPSEALIRGWRLHAEWVVEQIDPSHRPEVVSV